MIKEVVVVGSQTLPFAYLAQGFESYLSGPDNRVHMDKTLEEMDAGGPNPALTILSLTDLDWPVFKDIR